MNPFEGVHSEGVKDEETTRAPRYTRHRNGDGTFAGSMINPPGGQAADIYVVSKARLPKPPTPGLVPKALKLPKPPGMPKSATGPKVPSSTTMKAPGARVRESRATFGKRFGAERGDLVARQFKKGEHQRSMRAHPSFTKYVRGDQRLNQRIAKSFAPRQPLIPKPFVADPFWRRRKGSLGRAVTVSSVNKSRRGSVEEKISKMGPDQSEVHIMGSGQTRRRNPKPRYPFSERLISRG